MQYIKLVILGFQLLTAIANWLERRGYVKQAEADIIRRNADAAEKELAIAVAARQRVRDIIEREPERLRDTDKFERKDEGEQ
jgi:hypothetical protein